MYTFLKAEWKTILALVIFCGLIYTWFYTEELRKEELKNKPYVFECLKAGEGILNYQLGSPMEQMEAQLQNFKREDDPVLQRVRYESPDGAFGLNFRQNILASVEFYPEKTDPIPSCISDIGQWNKAIIAEPIQTAFYQDLIYEGMIQVRKMPEISDENAKPVEYGWIAVPK